MKAINVGNLSFDQYIARRLRKDGMGFIPGQTFQDGCTDRKTYIKAIIPRCHRDFMVYAHELGHCKGQQKIDPRMNAFWGGMTVTENVLFNEFSAWDWALCYMRRLGMKFLKYELEEVLNKTLGSYIKDVQEKGLVNYCNRLIDCFNEKYNVELERPTIRDKRFLQGDWYDIIRPTKISDKLWKEVKWDDVVVKNPYEGWISVDECVIDQPSKGQKRKPWMEIVDRKNKEFYKRNGGKK